MSRSSRKTKRLCCLRCDKETVDSWYKKDDWNTEEIIARGGVLTHLLNGHLISETIDHDTTYGKMRGKIGLEVESTGELFVAIST